MRNIIFTITFYCLLISISSGQQFIFKNAPYNMQEINMSDSCCPGMKCFFTDINGNKAKDVIIGGIKGLDTSFHHYSTLAQIRYFMEYQQNEGTLTQPQFKSRESIFESYEWEKGESFWVPDMKDLNDDGLLDFVVSAFVDSLGFQFLVFYIQKQDHSFERTISTEWNLDPFPPLSFMVPELTDLDMDGDYDILLSGYYCFNYDANDQINKVIYAKNVGTNTNPKFVGWYDNPYGLKPGNYPKQLSTGDLDLDGDLDVLALVKSGDSTYLEYYENKGGPGEKPLFGDPVISPFDIPIPAAANDTYFFMTLEDIDNDGDIDIFVPRQNGTTKEFTIDFFENVMCTPIMEILNENICEGEVFKLGDEVYNKDGTYYIKSKLSTCCLKITELNLKVNHDTTLVIEENLCRGDTYLVGDQEVTTSGEYQLNLNRKNGCDSIIKYFLNFFEINTIVIEGSQTLTAVQNSDYTYQWYDCDTKTDIQGATDYIFSPAYSGNFAVKILHLNGCKSQSDCHYVILSGIKESLSNSIKVSPNPTSGIVRIENFSEKKIDKVKIYNNSGVKIKEIYKPEDAIKVHLESDGIYYIIVEYGEYVIVKKVICIKE